jgi:23S rRNA pseudouridine2605 synthase
VPGPAARSALGSDEEGIRLQKVLAAAGLGARRACEVLIAEGRVSVDGEPVKEQGKRVDPETAVIRVDGMRITTSTTQVYLALNKPKGMVTAMTDPEGRPTVGDLVEGRKERLFHVGRLDAETEGLLLLTNDGELAQRLTHPSYEVPKTYLAELLGPLPRDVGRQLRAGVELEDGMARVDSFKLVDSAANRVLVEIVLHEGRKHIVRRMLDAVGFPVQRLVRTAIGPVQLGSQKSGRLRPLSRQELGALYELVGL